MGPWRRVRVAKCQLLVTSLFVLLLGLAMATVAALTYFGPHFTVIGHASSERTAYEALHLWAFSAGIILAGLLTLGAVLSAAATVREAGGLMAGAFVCFALVFCALVQVAFWRFHNPTQVEDSVLDTYDQVYEQAVRSSSGGIWRQELAAIQDTFRCCGKSSPLGLPGGAEADLCQGEEAARQDCLQGIRNFLGMHGNIASTLISLGLASTVYSLLLSAFLWFSIRSGRYTLSPRARGCQPQEPGFFRRCQEGPAPHPPSEAVALGGRLGHVPLLQDTHPPAHRSNRDAPASART
ncbi:tetraspanin-32 [Hippopotamus amphibius kiboko]|uniref:tetraspanin-32 n=1 Tax=Hippopotamus amphibius kiboko TaxID=575201 RepID=UPI0025988B9C|nr:tetraspanin-32 [Hippopotamus amphibius kiboko]